MKTFMASIAGLLVAAALPAFGAVTFITSCPLIINQPGQYHLKADLTCPSGYAITISSNDVELHFDGHSLNGGGTGLIGVLVSGVSNVSIFGSGTVSGFDTDIVFTKVSNSGITNVTTTNTLGGTGRIGIVLQNSNDNRLVNNTATGNNLAGILILGDNTLTSSGNTLISNQADNNAAGIVLNAFSNDNLLRANQANNNLTYGFYVYAGASNNLFQANKAHGNPTFDAFDGNTNCGSNTWKSNQFGTTNIACVQ